MKPVQDDCPVFDAATRLGLRLQALGLMVVTAESCTAGGVARALTETAGSSVWFERGWVTYSNRAKQEELGVSDQTLREHGAVSESTAAEMATGALARSPAHLALAITGIAGPGGAVPGKPVGTVCFGWALRRPHHTAPPLLRVRTVHLPGDRAAVRRTAAWLALTEALAFLEAAIQDVPPVA